MISLGNTVLTQRFLPLSSLILSPLLPPPPRYSGESEKAVRDLFAAARAKKPCIIFIDEVDSLGRSRGADMGGGGGGESMRRVKTELLTQMDGLGNDNDGVTVLGATNTPWELDGALRRRFQKRIFTPLPNAEERAVLLAMGIEGEDSAVSKKGLREVAVRTEGMSSSDLAGLVRSNGLNWWTNCLNECDECE